NSPTPTWRPAGAALPGIRSSPNAYAISRVRSSGPNPACPDPSSTTVLRNISPVPANAHTIDKAVVGAGCGPGVHTRWRSTRERGVQAAPGAPRGLKFLGIRAGRRKAREAGGESLARSAARKAYAAIHNAPW